MTPLDAIAASRFPFAVQHQARATICQHVRGAGEIGPRWRAGSNAYRDNRDEYLWSGEATPCPDCGCTEGMTSWQHYLACPACGWSEPAGDYDWWSLADVLRFKADEAAGLVEDQYVPAGSKVHGFDMTTSEGYIAFYAECARRLELREAGTMQPWQLAPEERLAQLRAERAGYVEGRAGRVLPADADDHFLAGHERGAALHRRGLATGMEVIRYA